MNMEARLDDRRQTHSFKGAMDDTVSWSLTNREAMRLMTALVRATFVELVCH